MVVTKFGSSKSKWPKIFVIQKICLVHENFGPTNVFGQKKMAEKYFGPKSFGSNKMLGRKNIGTKIMLSQKKVWVQKNFGTNECWVQK